MSEVLNYEWTFELGLYIIIVNALLNYEWTFELKENFWISGEL